MEFTQELILRGNTTIRTISGKSYTLFELAGRSNIIQGYVINSETQESYITPLEISVDTYLMNFFGLETIKAIEFKSDNIDLAISSNNIEINIIDGKTYLGKKHIKTLSNDILSVKHITESRIYYKATFKFISDISHIKGDYIYIFLNDNFLIHKWCTY